MKQTQLDDWNDAHPPGSRVLVTLEDGGQQLATTLGLAVSSSSTAIVLVRTDNGRSFNVAVESLNYPRTLAELAQRPRRRRRTRW